MENNTFKVPSENLGWLKGKLEKLNRRANKLGMPPVELIILEEKVEPFCRNFFNGSCQSICTCNQYRKYVTVEIKGQAPSIAGWDFIGRIDHTQAGNLLQLLPGQSIPEHYRQDSQNCDHCHQKRTRISTYILINAQNEYKQVGKSCLQDFFQQDVTNVVARAELLASVNGLREESEHYSSSHQDWSYKLEEYLGFVVVVVEKYGWVSRMKCEELNKTPTSIDAAILMIRPTSKEAQLLKIRPTEEHFKKGAELVVWIKAYLNKPQLSDYEHNLKVIVDSGFCDWHTFGLAASISALHYRETTAKAEKTAQKPSEYVGEVGKRIKGLTLTLAKITNLGEGEFGMRYLVRFIDANMNVLVWFTTSLNGEEGKQYTVAGTIREHSEYKGTKQTVLTRCKLAELLTTKINP